MRAFTLALGLVALPLAFATDAPVVANNPIGTQYIAVLPDKNDTTVRGAVAISTNSNGTGASVQVSISGLPATGGPFMYHIHKFPVSGLNCTSAGSHLDPYGATEVPPCDPTTPSKCEVGDLSGKHGNATGSSFSANYVDPYLSTTENTPAFVGNLSIVVHSSDKTRLTCANFSLQGKTKSSSHSSGHTVTHKDPLSTGDPTAAPSDVPSNATASVGGPAEPTTTTVTADAGADKIFGNGGTVAGVLGGVMAVGAWLI